jgi:hypothetical protein
MNMELNLSYLTIATILLGLALLLTTIMGLFGSNKFDVNGKVGGVGLATSHQQHV